jgi:pre-mRNA-processing factor 8
LTVGGFEWGRKNTDVTGQHAGYNASMANRVQLLLSDRILGMTLVPEGGVWNYGVGLTQSWNEKIAYNMTLDKPESFWAPCHRPVSLPLLTLMASADHARTLSSTLLLWKVTILRMWRIVWLKRRGWSILKEELQIGVWVSVKQNCVCINGFKYSLGSFMHLVSSTAFP